jgi:hypothetical protein
MPALTSLSLRWPFPFWGGLFVFFRQVNVQCITAGGVISEAIPIAEPPFHFAVSIHFLL